MSVHSSTISSFGPFHPDVRTASPQRSAASAFDSISSTAPMNGTTVISCSNFSERTIFVRTISEEETEPMATVAIFRMSRFMQRTIVLLSSREAIEADP